MRICVNHGVNKEEAEQAHFTSSLLILDMAEKRNKMKPFLEAAHCYPCPAG
jgi:hypothetical protein